MLKLDESFFLSFHLLLLLLLPLPPHSARYAEAAKEANWHAAMEEEMRALPDNETWDFVEKGKKKMTEYGTDRRKSDSKKSYDGPSTSKFWELG